MKRNIVVSKYLADVGAVKNVTAESLDPWIKSGEISIGGRAPDGDSFVLSWGDPQVGSSCIVVETGFFWDAAHVDTIGLYRYSSLNTLAGVAAAQSFEAPRSAQDIVLGGTLPASKYRQTRNPISWDGVVLACQNPADRSVLRGHSVEDYWRFFEGACQHYGEHLYVKLHPWNSGDVEKRMVEIARMHGCGISKCDHSVIERARFVLVYNSTFAVDCFVRRVPVAQFAPGYFWQTPAVTFTGYSYPDDVKDSLDAGSRLADFLLWRYCFSIAMPIEKWVRMLRHLSTSTEIFPVDGEFAYAANLAH